MSTLSAAIETAVRLIEGEISSTEYRIAICELDKIETHDIKADVAKWRDQIKALKAVGSSTPAPQAPEAGLRPEYIEMMRAHVDEGGQLSHKNGIDLLAEVERIQEKRS